MFGTGNRIQVAKIGGIPIYVSFSWLIIAALFGFSYYTVFSGQSGASGFPSTTDPSEALRLTIVFTVLFFGGVLLHEAAHAIAARSFGLPVRAITLVFWGGATEARTWTKGPLADFVVAAAGPATTAVLGVVFLVIGHRLGHTVTGQAFETLGDLNLFFAAFNAIPGFPLDGGRMLMAGAWAVTKNRARALRVAGVGSILVGGGLIAYAIVNFSSGGTFSIFLGYIGFVMISVARQIPAQAGLREKLLRGTAAEAMRPIGEGVPASTPVYDATERWLRSQPDRAFPVYDDGRIVGTISLDDARDTAASRPVRDAMKRLDQDNTVAADEPLDDVVEWIGGRQTLVQDQAGRTIGLIDLHDVDRWLHQHWATGQFVERPVVVVPPRPDL